MNNDKLTFELALDRVNEIAALLSAGQVSLAESMELYKEACTLVNSCREMLQAAELELVEITNAAQLAFDGDEEETE